MDSDQAGAQAGQVGERGFIRAMGLFPATALNMAQIVGLTILRHKQPGLRRPYRQWLYPVPSILALAGWIYIFQASGWAAIRIMLGWTVLGIIAFLVWARAEHVWPFGPKEIREEFAGGQAGQEASRAPGS